MYHFYILYSNSLDKFYLGSTSLAPEERLKKHLTNHKGYTARAKDWKIVYTEIYNTKTNASERERMVKGWKSKQRILQLVNNR